MHLSVIATCLSLSLIGFSAADDARASIRQETSIPPEGLAPALKTLAKERNFQIVYITEEVANLRTQGAVGEFTPEEALKRLLTGTGLVFRYLDDRTVTVFPLDSATAVSTGSGHSVAQDRQANSSETSGAAAPTEGMKNSSGDFRLAQANQRSTPSTFAVGNSSQGNGPPFSEIGAQSSEGQVPGLEEVIVTARRVEESTQKVPIAITALSASDLRGAHINSIAELTENVAGLVNNATGAGGDQNAVFMIRGQGVSFGGAPGVLTYFADVPGLNLDSTNMSIDGRPGSYIDLANIQVLKGPQGTLFGRNTTGGNVLFVPQRPTDNFEGYITAGLGNYSDRSIEGAVNIPVIPDSLLIRISGGAEGRDGFVKDTGPLNTSYEALDYQTLRIGVLVKPNDSFENYLITRYYHDDEGGPAWILTKGSPTTNSQFVALAAQQAALGPYTVAQGPLPPYDKTQYAQAINTTTWKVSNTFILKNIVSYAHMEEAFGTDVDGTILPILTQTQVFRPIPRYDVYSEELQATGKVFDDHFSYSAGLYYDHAGIMGTQITDFQYYPFTTPLVPPIPPNTIPGVSPIPGYPVEQEYNGDSIGNRAVYSQATLDLGVLNSVLEGLKVTAGTRYTWEKMFGDDWTVLSNIVDAHSRSTYKNSYPSYTFDLSYQLDPRTLLYMSVRDAYKSGGINIQVPESSPAYTYGPEKLTSYEVGFKSTAKLSSVEIQMAADAFYGAYTNIQTTAQNPAVAVVAYAANAAAAKIQGIEVDGRAQFVNGIGLSLSYAYTDSAYTTISSIAQANLLGAPFPNVAKQRITITPDYVLPFIPRSEGSIKLRASYAYQSPITYVTSNAPSVLPPYLPGYGLISAGLDWARFLGHDNLSLTAYARNLLDKEYVTARFDFYAQAGFISSEYGEPRTFGAQFRYAF
jgi:iron complex outermembrane recepter protein